MMWGYQTGWFGWVLMVVSMGLLWTLVILAIIALLRDLGTGGRRSDQGTGRDRDHGATG